METMSVCRLVWPTLTVVQRPSLRALELASLGSVRSMGQAKVRSWHRSFDPIHYDSRRLAIDNRGNGQHQHRSCVAMAAAASSSAVPAVAGRSGSAVGPPEVAAGEKSSIDLNPPRGTRDFSPDDMRLRTWLFQAFRKVSSAFGFEEVDYPVLESEQLYIRKAGEEITQQLFNFTDKGGRRVALRPELTPSLARLVLQKGKGIAYPLKWYAIGQCWRYERMTRGRRREHYQWNMDILGVAGVQAETELLAALVMFFEEVGLTASDVGIKVSSRKVLSEVLAKHGVGMDVFGAVAVIVDKIEKIPREEVEKELGALGLSPEGIAGILSALSLRDLEALEGLLGAENTAVQDLRQLFDLAQTYGFRDWLQFDASVVRGLAYYTGVVFEGFDRQGQLRAICGGGRYDRLLSTFGGEDTPACGFGFGDAVIVELLKERGLLPTASLAHHVDDVVLAMEPEGRMAAVAAASRLRRAGRTVDLVLEDGKRMKWAFKHADRLTASRLIIVGANEVERGVVRVKDLTTRQEEDVNLDSLF